VIIGKLIPAGTGFIHGRFTEEQAQNNARQWSQLPDSSIGD
jgi:hypothetical protein